MRMTRRCGEDFSLRSRSRDFRERQDSQTLFVTAVVFHRDSCIRRRQEHAVSQPDRSRLEFTNVRSAGGPIHLPLEFPNTIGVAGVRLKWAERARRHAELCGGVPYENQGQGPTTSQIRRPSPAPGRSVRAEHTTPASTRSNLYAYAHRRRVSASPSRLSEQLSSRSRTRSSSSSINGPTTAGHLKSPDRAPRHEVYAQAGLFGRCVRRVLISFAPVQSAP